MRWRESAQRWMAWVRFPDGSRRKVERVSRADAEADLQRLLDERAGGGAAPTGRDRLLSFGEVLDAWIEAGCPSASANRRTRHVEEKSPNTVANARSLLDTHVRPVLGSLRVDRTKTDRVEQVFATMARRGRSTSTIDRTWGYLNQACQHAQRHGRIRTNPAETALLPAARPAKRRKSLSVDEVQRLRSTRCRDAHPAMWLTGLMCGLRPGAGRFALVLRRP